MSESLSCVRFNSSIAKVGVFNKTVIPYLHKSLNNMRDYNAILELAKEKAVTPHFYLHAIRTRLRISD